MTPTQWAELFNRDFPRLYEEAWGSEDPEFFERVVSHDSRMDFHTFAVKKEGLLEEVKDTLAFSCAWHHRHQVEKKLGIPVEKQAPATGIQFQFLVYESFRARPVGDAGVVVRSQCSVIIRRSSKVFVAGSWDDVRAEKQLQDDLKKPRLILPNEGGPT